MVGERQRQKSMNHLTQLSVLLAAVVYTYCSNNHSLVFLSQAQALSHVRLVDVLNRKKKKKKQRRHQHPNYSVPQQQQHQHPNEPRTTLFVKEEENDDDDDDDVQELFFSQRLDHDRMTDTRHFPQRYFYSDRYVRKETTTPYSNTTTTIHNIAFLCVGGEGPALTQDVLMDSPHCSGDMLETAKRLYYNYHDDDNGDDDTTTTTTTTNNNHLWSIHLFALEHRYYGASYPVFDGDDDDNNNNNSSSPVTNENLVYLSSRQALQDIAHFCKTILVTQPAVHWITFGGSYPGMLAAWARLKFPQIIQAAVSNSAPIQALVDFAAYNNHVGHVLLHDPTVGGSPECYEVFREGHEQVLDTILWHPTNELADLERDFQLCNVTSLLQDPRNIQIFVGDGVYGLNTQGNDPACSGYLCNIEQTCKAAVGYYENHATNRTDGKHAMETLGWLVREFNQHHQEPGYCLELDWKKTLAYMADPEQGQEGGLRSWLWQTCTEFGFYQTCEYGSTCPFGQGWHPLSEDLEVCKVAFGVTNVMEAVQATNEYYGGWKLPGSRILSVTGTVDPWTELSKTRTVDPILLPVHTVPGASHHFWTHAVKESDSEEVQQAREAIYETTRAWLLEIVEEAEFRKQEILGYTRQD